jgi:predicted transposase YbfD/YdcC
MESPTLDKQGPQTVELILKHFSTLEDPRVERTRFHSLQNVLVIALCGVIAGADGWDGVALFAKARTPWLATFLDMPKGVPCADTFRRVFGALDERAFEACFRAWVQSLSTLLSGEVVAVDGKSVRGALGQGVAGTPLHLVHVWATEQRLLLAQMAAKGGAPGEVRAVPELLKLLNLQGAVVTTDANGCTSKVAQAVVEAGADYVLALKGNRGPLHEHVKDLFAPVREGQQQARVNSHSRSVDSGHGRHEVRTVFALSLSPKRWPKSADKWPGLRTAVLVKRERTLKGSTRVQWHYYLSSLPPKARQLARAIRAHWGVENRLHWSLDVGMNEDARRIRDHSSAQNFALLSRIALTLLKRETTCKHGVPTRRKKAAWDTDYLLLVLKAGNTGL